MIMKQATRTASRDALLNEFVQDMTAAAKRLALYPSDHPACKSAAQKPYSVLLRLWEGAPKVILSLAQGRLVGDGIPLEPRWAKEGLGKIMTESRIQSLGFFEGVTPEDFQSFIAYLNTKAENRDVHEFLQSNAIQNIEVDKQRYELVGEDESVISSDLVDEHAEEVGEFRDALLDVLKAQPELLVELFAPKGAVGTGSGSGAHGGNGKDHGQDGSGDGADGGHSDSSVIRVAQTDLDAAMRELGALSDEQLLRMLVSGLERAVGSESENSEVSVSRALFALKEIVERRQDPELLSKLRHLLEESEIVNQKQIDIILREKASPEGLAQIEAENFLTSFAKGEVEQATISSLFRWMELVRDPEFHHDLIEHLYRNLDELGFDLSSEQQTAASRLAEEASKAQGSQAVRSFTEEILRRLKNTAIGVKEMSFLSEQIKVVFATTIASGRFEEAEMLLPTIVSMGAPVSKFSEDVAKMARQLKSDLCAPATATQLVKKLAADFAGVNKQITPLLEQFSGPEIASVFVEHISHDDRGVRMLMIRLLSRMGDDVIEVLRPILEPYCGEKGGSAGRDIDQETWFALRNMVLVLGNIRSQASLEMLKLLCVNADERLVSAVLEALEDADSEQAAEAVIDLLEHPNSDIQRKALVVLGRVGSVNHWEQVRDFFLKQPAERSQALTVLIDLDKDRTTAFLVEVLDGRSALIRKSSEKANESLNELIVNTFIRWRSEKADRCLRRYVDGATRSLLGHFRKPTSVRLAERYLKSRSK